METASTVVIKVNYGDIVRRFSVQIVDKNLNLDMDGLRGKILSLFSLAPDTEFVLTYIDEDDDVVTLVDADDLRDVVKQGLNPLRITVKLSSKNHARQFNHSSRVQKPVRNQNAGVSEILKTMPEPLQKTLVKLWTDLTSKALSSPLGVAQLVDDYISNLGLSNLGQLSESHTKEHLGTTSDVPGDSLAQTEMKDSDLSKVNAMKVPSDGREERYSKCSESLAKLQPEATKENNEVTLINGTGGASSGVGSTKVNVGNKEKVKKIKECYSNGKSNLMSSCSPTFVNQNLCLERKRAELPRRFVDLPSVGNNVPTEKKINEPSEPHPGSKIASNGSDPMEVITDKMSRGLFYGDCGNLIWPSEPHIDGIPFEKISAPQSSPVSQAAPLRSSSSQDDSIGGVVHFGVHCSGCGMYPITGPRFKSKVKVDYDLCSICFSNMENGIDYIRMDHPAIHQNHVSFKNQAPKQPNVCHRVSNNESCAFKLNSCFVRDVSVTDGTLIAPLTPFTKIWQMRNNGTVVWPQKTQIVWIGGDRLSNQFSVELQIPPAGVAVNQEIDITVNCISPGLPGQYISYWRMVSPDGEMFGERVWILIQVDGLAKETPLDLSLPPDRNFLNDHSSPLARGASSSIPYAGLCAPLPSPSIASPLYSALVPGNNAYSWPSSLDYFAGLPYLNPVYEKGYQTMNWDPTLGYYYI